MKNNHHADFIGYLQKLVDNNKSGAVAALKRSLQSETTSQLAAYSYVVPFLPKDKRENDWAYFLVAGLFALHPDHRTIHPGDDPEKPKRIFNLGATCRSLGTEEENPTASWVLRFKALLDAEKDDVAHHLRGIVSLAASKNVAVNYIQLLTDLCNWSHRDKYVQLAMAREFWRLPEQENKKDENATV